MVLLWFVSRFIRNNRECRNINELSARLAEIWNIAAFLLFVDVWVLMFLEAWYVGEDAYPIRVELDESRFIQTPSEFVHIAVIERE